MDSEKAKRMVFDLRKHLFSRNPIRQQAPANAAAKAIQTGKLAAAAGFAAHDLGRTNVVPRASTGLSTQAAHREFLGSVGKRKRP